MSSKLAIDQRRIGAVVGSIIADAAAVPLHWIYDQEKVQGIVENGAQPEFLPSSHCPFYQIPTGNNSCYGDQTFVLLQSLVECKGFDKADYKRRLFERFGPESAYEVQKSGDGKHEGPWRNASIKEFLKNYTEGKDKTGKAGDAQADGMAKMAPLVALYAGHPDLLKIAEEVIRVTQEDDDAVRAGVAVAQILEHQIMHGGDVKNLMSLNVNFNNDVKDWLSQVEKIRDECHVTATKTLGWSCALPGSLQSSVHCVLRSDGTFLGTLRQTLTSGGDNCARSSVAGGILGAQTGLAELPQDWISRTNTGSRALQLAEQLVALRQ